MLKALAVLLWPLGIAAVLVLTARLAPRPSLGTASVTDQNASDTSVSPRSARSSVIGMLLILTVGAIAVYAMTCLLGLLAVHAGPSIDTPMYSWTVHHRVHFWTAVMTRLAMMGYTWTTWGAAVAAAACLAAFYRQNKWLSPVALGAAVVIDHFLTLALRHTFERVGPPDSPRGMFPAGGCDRIFVIYGLIGYLAWRELGGSKRAAIWLSGVVAALGFSEAYSHFYLSLDWFTDTISGLIYGALILAVFIATIQLVVGPARKPVTDVNSSLPIEASGQPTPTLQ